MCRMTSSRVIPDRVGLWLNLGQDGGGGEGGGERGRRGEGRECSACGNKEESKRREKQWGEGDGTSRVEQLWDSSGVPVVRGWKESFTAKTLGRRE